MYLFISAPIIIIFNTFSAKKKQYIHHIDTLPHNLRGELWLREYKTINKWNVRVLQYVVKYVAYACTYNEHIYLFFSLERKKNALKHKRDAMKILV